MSDESLFYIDEYSTTGNNFLGDGYMEDNEESVNSWEYFEDTLESSIEYLEEGYPLKYTNHSKELDVSKVVDDQDGMTDVPIPEISPDLGTPPKKTVGTRFHTFTLNNIKISAWP